MAKKSRKGIVRVTEPVKVKHSITRSHEPAFGKYAFCMVAVDGKTKKIVTDLTDEDIIRASGKGKKYHVKVIKFYDKILY